MKDMKKVTIIVPAYNASSFIRDALDSLKNQDYPAMEVVCINDGSTDDTAGILDSYAASHPWLRVIHQENRGQTRTMNRLLDEVAQDTDYVMMLDSDDAYHPAAIKTCLHLMEQQPCDVLEFGVVRGDRVPSSFSDATATILEVTQTRREEDMGIYFSKSTRKHGWISKNNKFYQWSVIKDLRFREVLSYDDDHFYAFELNQIISSKILSSVPLLFYRVNPNSVTQKLHFPRFVQATLACIGLCIDEFVKTGVVPSQYREEFIQELANDAFRQVIKKNLRKNRDKKQRQQLAAVASDAMEAFFRDGIITPRHYKLSQRLGIALLRKKYYALARIICSVS